MPAMPLRQSLGQSLPAPVAPSRADTLHIVSTGSLAEVLWPDSEIPASPAHALQQRLLQTYMAAPIHAPREDRLPLAARSAIILGVAASLWLAIGGAVALIFAFA